MYSAALLDRIRSVFVDVFGDSAIDIKPETSPQDIPDWDSVAQVKLVLALEETFDVEFTTDEVADFRTVADFTRALTRRGFD